MPKVRTMEPKEQPLLANGSETAFISRQRLGKHVPATTDTHVTIEVLFETALSTRSVQTGYKEDGEVSNTSTVTLRVVGGDEKGSLESESVKCGYECRGSRTREWLRWRAPAAIVNDRPALSSERAPHINKPATDSNTNLVVSLRLVLYSKTDRLTIGRKVGLRSSMLESVKKGDSWKEAAIQRGLECRSWRISTVRSRYQRTARKDLACAVIFKVWMLAVDL
jgi:hypothetical protein